MTNITTARTATRRWAAAATTAALIGASLFPLASASASAPASTSASASAATAPASARAAAPLTNLAHLDFLLDTATPAPVAGHTTYDLATEPAITMPWVYANARPDGSFTRVGGGPLDAATGHWGQGSYDADDVARAAVVYIRDWQQTGSAAAKQNAYELLRSTAYFQTISGPNAGNVVLWMQPDGTLNPSPTPVELPNPSDSGDSYWLARSLWAFGEGFAAFQNSDPAFAAFLQQRLQLGVKALDRESLKKFGQFAVADGVRVPAWLIVDGADASGEAVLGLSAYSAKVPGDKPVRTALSELAEGIADMGTAAPGSADTSTWPYGAILPWAESRSMWHAWASQMPAALAAASVTLGKSSLLKPAIADSVSFTPTLLTAGGPDNAWYPTPIDTTQIAYGADSRLQSLLAVAKAADLPGLRQLAAIMGSWYFGANASGQPIYDPTTGVTFDGVQPDGTINRNSGAESTIHGLLSMLALDANPDVAAASQAATHVTLRDGLTVVQAEAATATSGTQVTPASTWTGESQYGGTGYLQLAAGQTATFAIGSSTQQRSIAPVTFEAQYGSARSTWTTGTEVLGMLRERVGAQGITAIPGALLPQTLPATVPMTVPVPAEGSAGPAGATVTVRATHGTVILDSIIVRPLVSRLVLSGAAVSTELVQSSSSSPAAARVGVTGQKSAVRSYDGKGSLVGATMIVGVTTITLAPGGFAVVTAG